MSAGTGRRIASMWFPRLPSDRVLRATPLEGPFALTLREGNTERIHCLNPAAEAAGLARGMGLADARAFCPALMTDPARPDREARFLEVLRRWAMRYCPWVGTDGADGLVLDVTGSAHLMGGEEAMLDDMATRAARSGLTLRAGLADTRGAAWALAHHARGATARAAPGETAQALAPLPVTALRLDPAEIAGLERLGLRTVGALEAAARAPLARRFGPGLLVRLDQAMGRQGEAVSPAGEAPHYATRLTLPEPIGLEADVMEGTRRLLERLCEKLDHQETGARTLCLTLRRVDRDSRQVELRLAAPMRDPVRILPLFRRGLEEVDAGYGIDQMRLEATLVEPLPARQLSPRATGGDRARVEDLITRIGTRIGLENVQRFRPADSHIPERAFQVVPAAFAGPEAGPEMGPEMGAEAEPHTANRAGAWAAPRPRPLRLFPPEPIAGHGPRPPVPLRWRRMSLTPVRVTGPERIAPEWWFDLPGWRRGLRDYWTVDTREGRRLWLFHTPQDPAWFVEGEFA
ncbi:Y-family DNA polymerase [Pseudooceanicola marinus]|uniref:Y-family DNA polymerase n=1 Tax=Pseudooceanicola marinus TaxID=396013 RepID=UPI001CD36E8A|nr:DNA polymerase Y family protein [Pseudooceanicola marinus]MCA1334792.1 DNA polymerase Y family protein [Pseudooceanicola marinus]